MSLEALDSTYSTGPKKIKKKKNHINHTLFYTGRNKKENCPKFMQATEIQVQDRSGQPGGPTLDTQNSILSGLRENSVE